MYTFTTVSLTIAWTDISNKPLPRGARGNISLEVLPVVLLDKSISVTKPNNTHTAILRNSQLAIRYEV
jgi:hypothetical protein